MGFTKTVRSAACWTFRWGLEVLIALVVATLVAAMFFGPGCAASTRVTPASTAIEQQIESAPRTTTTKRITGFTPDGKPITEETTVAEPGVVRSRVVGTATGAGASATGDKLDQKIDSGAPTLNLPGVGKGSGGGFSGDMNASVGGVSVFYLVGGMVILAGVASLALKKFNPMTGVCLIAGGIALAMIGVYPAIGVLILIGVVVLGVVKLMHADQAGKSANEALRTLWAAVKTSGGDVVAKVGAKIDEHSDGHNEAGVIASIDRMDWPSNPINQGAAA